MSVRGSYKTLSSLNDAVVCIIDDVNIRGFNVVNDDGIQVVNTFGNVGRCRLAGRSKGRIF
jgi:hypothetical protein